MNRQRRAAPRALRSKAATFLLVVGSVAGIAVPARADQVSNKKAQAAAINKKINDFNDYAEALTEQMNQAQDELDQTAKDIAALEAKLAEQDATVAQLGDDLAKFAISSYQYGDQTGGIGSLFSGDALAGGVAQRAGYSPLLLGQNADVTDGVKAAREDTARLQQQLTAKQKRQQQLTATIQQKQAAVQKAVVDLDAVQAQVKGDLVQLVADAELAQEAAAVAAAKTAAERQAAELRRQREQQRQQQNAGGAAGGATGGNAGGATGGQTTGGNPGGVKAPPANIPDFPAPSPGAATAVAAAKSQLGVPYKFAAATPNVAFDCSGLTMWAWGRAGVGMAHFARSQYEAFPHVPLDSLQPGDLVFFYQDVHHVGIYIGGGLMIDAPHTGATVRVTTMYTRNLIGAARPG